METLRHGLEIRWLFQAGLLIFVVTIGLGMARGLGLLAFESENEWLTHLHSGVIGWITLGILGAGLWLYGGDQDRGHDEPLVTWSAILLVVAAPTFVVAWWIHAWPLLTVTGTAVTLGIVLYMVWMVRAAAAIGYRRLTTPQLGVLVGLLTLIVGSAIGVLIAIQEATGAFELPAMVHMTHAETQISAYLVLVSMAIAYWRLRGHDRTAGGTWMVGLFFGAGAIIAGSLLAGSIEGTIGFLPLDIAAFAIFLALTWRRVLMPGWLDRGAARHYAIAVPFALFYLAIFGYLVLGMTALGLWADPSQIPPNLIPAASHPLFVGTVTNILFGLLLDLEADAHPAWPWADHLVFWGTNLAVAGFTAAILLEAEAAFAPTTSLLGMALLVGITVHTVRLQAARPSPTRSALPAS